MHNPSNATTDDPFTFPISTADGNFTIPQAGTLRLDGQDSKILVANYQLGRQHLVYSTSELMTHFSDDGTDLALLYLGVDVNVAARVTAAAKAGQVPVSDALLAQLDPDAVRTGRATRLRANGTPSGLRVASVTR